MDHKAMALLSDFAKGNGRLTVMTGAGISAESGIPTFRGPEGYWTVGSSVYHPQEMATWSMFQRDPEAVWAWYLYRWGVCTAAEPNAGHLALVEMEKLLKDRFLVITQNVDGLHLRAGNSPERTFQIHGNVGFIRCAAGCTNDIFPMPPGVAPKKAGQSLTDMDRQLLLCPRCSGLARPHVLWFDEIYNEIHFRFESALAAAAATDLLLVVGTAGATNLPNQVAWTVQRRGGVIVDIDIASNPFSQMASGSEHGCFIQGPSGKILPRILEIFKDETKT